MAEARAKESVKKSQPTAVYTDEDAELDRKLEELDRAEAPQQPIDEHYAPPVVKEKFSGKLLSDEIDDLMPAASMAELTEQVHQAKELGCDCIYATEALIKRLCRVYPDDVGYFVYHGVKVYIPGFFEQAMKRDNMSIQEKVFGLPGDKK